MTASQRSTQLFTARYGEQQRRAVRMVDRREAGRKRALVPRTGKRRRLDEAAIERVCAFIRVWPHAPLTWEELTAAVADRERGGWTRQTLSTNGRIAEVYAERKAALRKKPARPPRDPALIMLQRDVEHRDGEIARLQGKLVEYEERFLVMRRNAAIRGLTEEELLRPLLPVDRKKA